jgi:hypothetical protein
MTTGDHIWLERPGVWLSSFTECASGTGNGASNTLFAGFGVQTSMAIGHSDDPSQVNYTHVVTAPTLTITNTNVTGRPDGIATVNLEPTYKDETGALISPVGFGIWAKGIQFSGLSFNATYSAFAVGLSVISARSIWLSLSSLRSGIFNLASDVFQLSNLNYGAITLQHSGNAVLTGVRGVSAWSPSIQVSPAGATASVSFQDMHNLLLAVPEAEPDFPGITLKSGQYTVTLEFGTESIPGTISCGNGVRVEYDGGSQFTLVNYDSLQATGFEVIGGQKVVCKTTGAFTGYAGDVLPCPRGVPMKIVNYPGCTDYPLPMPSGLVVGGTTDTGGEQAVFLNSGIYAPQNIIGVTLTNYTNNADFGGGITGGWVVVGNDPVMVLRKDSVSVAPAIGAPVFASFHDEFTPSLTGGFSVTEFQAGVDYPSYCLGYVLPIGNTAGVSVPVFWKPSHLNSQIGKLSDTFAPFTKTNDTVLADIPGMFIMVDPGVTYRIDISLSLLSFGVTPNGGFKVSISGNATTGSNASLIYSFLQEYPDPTGAMRVPLLGLVQSVYGIDDGNFVSYVGGTTGTMVVSGSVSSTSGGYLYVRFAQAVATPGCSSYVVAGSSITAVRQG